MNKDDQKMKYKISELKKTYNSYNYPGPQRMYELLKDKGITKEEIHAFIEKQQPEQAFRPVYYPRKASQGSIVAYYPNERWQMDIFNLFNFVSSWKKSSYKYAFCVIDVFTRKAWTVPMTHKNANCTINALQQILSEVNNEKKPESLPEGDRDAPETIPEEPAPIIPAEDDKPTEEKDKHKFPKMITCDQDSVFLGDAFGELLDEYQITLDAYIKGDHNALGVIDSFAKKYKLALAKYILVNNNKVLLHQAMSKVLKNYNNTPNTAIDDIKPNEAHLKENREKIYSINLDKKKGKAPDSDLKEGDSVRIAKLKNVFSKSSNPTFGDEIYKVEFAQGNNVKLDNNKTYKRYSVLKVVNNSKPISTEYVQENARKKKTYDELNKLGADTENIQTDVARPKSSRNKKSEKYIEYQKSLQKTSSKPHNQKL